MSSLIDVQLIEPHEPSLVSVKKLKSQIWRNEPVSNSNSAGDYLPSRTPCHSHKAEEGGKAQALGADFTICGTEGPPEKDLKQTRRTIFF